jgi:hypothetical protein
MQKLPQATIAAALFALASLATAPAAAVNKCTGADGKVVFQDAPCMGKGETITVRPASGHANASSAESAARTRSEIAGIEWRSQTAGAIARGEPLVGMTRAEVDQAMGAPTRVNANNYAGVQKDQVIYERPGVTWLVYTETGKVTSIQKRPSINASAGPSVLCPTPFEIRNMQVSASSSTVSDGERVERQKQVSEAMRCGR